MPCPAQSGDAHRDVSLVPGAGASSPGCVLITPFPNMSCNHTEQLIHSLSDGGAGSKPPLRDLVQGHDLATTNTSTAEDVDTSVLSRAPVPGIEKYYYSTGSSYRVGRNFSVPDPWAMFQPIHPGSAMQCVCTQLCTPILTTQRHISIASTELAQACWICKETSFF